MKSSIDVMDELEVVDEKNGLWARIRVRETRLGIKASVLLTPDELVTHAYECLALAAAMRERR